MINNPFTSDIFTNIWSKHFNHSASGSCFASVRDLYFTKHKFLPLYSNYGKTHTKGISYTFDGTDVSDIKGKVLLIYDVPTFFKVTEITKDRIKTYKVKQYPGFLMNLEPYKDLNEFMVGTFKKGSRYKLKKYKRKLETCFDIRYKMFYGEISKRDYDFVFEAFNKLLMKRFDYKQVTNNNLENDEWDFYYEVAYPMILEKKAGLFVVYNGDKPIGVTLNYFSDEILFDAITVFDIDYSKFNLGSVSIMKLVEWSIEQKLKLFDFSKGYFDYKKRWASDKYDFEYHLIYDSKSSLAKLLAFAIKTFLEFKQFLRDKKVNEKLHKLTYMFKQKSNLNVSNPKFELSDYKKNYSNKYLKKVEINDSEYQRLIPSMFEYLYLNNESLPNLIVYKVKGEDNLYVFSGMEKESLVRAI